MISETTIRARIDSETKERAAEALEAMGLSISDAIRLLMVRVAREKKLPFEVRVPNAETQEAIRELATEQGNRVHSVDELFAELHRD
jgi:DNA-damage-inducible protein J